MAEAAEAAESTPDKLVVVDLGRKKEKHVKRLRKGTGKLLDQVLETVSGLQEDGVLEPDVQTVVVVVERKLELPWAT